MWGLLGQRDVGIDLGTCSVIVFVSGKGIVIKEPSVVAKRVGSKDVVAVGEEAKRMVGRTPGDIVTVRPLRKGVISDFDVTEIMIKYFLGKSLSRHVLFRPRILLCVPAAVTSVERRAVLQAGQAAGGGKVFLIEEPYAAALGAGLDIAGPVGHMVVDIGGGTSDIAVLSLNGIVTETSTRVGGDALDDAIVRYVRRVYKLVIGEGTSELAKITVGTAFPGIKKEIEIRGRDIVSGLPRSVIIDSYDLLEAMKEPLEIISQAVRWVLEKTPPELLGDIIERGIILTGGGALLHGIDAFLRDETGIPVHVAEDPVTCVAQGTKIALEKFDKYAMHMRTPYCLTLQHLPHIS